MNHWVFAPMAVPLAAAALILLCGRDLGRQRIVSGLAAAAGAAVAVRLLVLASTGEHAVYLLGNWPAPYGIVLVLDRLSALMLALGAVVGLACVAAALGGWDGRGRHFHALLQLQLFGLNGAFLTGDLFNLFVFFEVLLIASYGLLLHGGGARRAAAATHYVVYNLVASTLFLFAVAVLYGVTGTLNMADLALQVAAAAPEDAALVRAAGLMLFVVFAVKAAVVPLSFWLQGTYAAASAPVAVLFAIMTKVGFYAIVRVYTLVFGHEAGPAALLLEPWLMPLALATLAVATLGALASRDLVVLATHLVVVSVGTQLLGVATWSERGVAAALYYMSQSTLALAWFFLVAERIGVRRAGAGTQLTPARLSGPANASALLYLGAAIALAGLPPLAGFIGKAALLQSVADHAWRAAAFAALLASSLLVVVALARSGSLLFWKGAPEAGAVPAVVPGAPADAAATPLPAGHALALGGLAAAVVALTVLARPAYDYMQAAAEQLVYPAAYIQRVLLPGATDIIVDPERLRALSPGGAS